LKIYRFADLLRELPLKKKIALLLLTEKDCCPIFYVMIVFIPYPDLITAAILELDWNINSQILVISLCTTHLMILLLICFKNVLGVLDFSKIALLILETLKVEML